MADTPAQLSIPLWCNHKCVLLPWHKPCKSSRVTTLTSHLCDLGRGSWRVWCVGYKEWIIGTSGTCRVLPPWDGKESCPDADGSELYYSCWYCESKLEMLNKSISQKAVYLLKKIYCILLKILIISFLLNLITMFESLLIQPIIFTPNPLHVVLLNHLSLFIVMERRTCLNDDCGMHAGGACLAHS